MMKWLCPLLLFFTAFTVHQAQSGRVKRFAQSGCRMQPDNDKFNVIEESTSVTLSCDFDNNPETCIWTHSEPMNEGETISPDIRCSAGKGESGHNCVEDTRVKFEFSGVRCGITISDTKPEDSGYWRLTAVAVGSAQGGQVANYDFRLNTYNRSTVYMLDEDENDISNGDFDTSYNYNDRQHKWEQDKSSWETVEFICRARGGRPQPEFIWYIENNNNDNLGNEKFKDWFKVSDSSLGCADRYDYICDTQSRIEFTIDDKLMEFLEENYAIDTNNKDDLVKFELNCEADQGDNAFVEKVSVELNIDKRYDNGVLASDTIGIIVGCVLAVVIIVIVVAILVFAKASGRWCFAESDDPRKQRKGPAPRGGGHRGGHTQQVHSEATTITATDKDKTAFKAEASPMLTKPNTVSPTIPDRKHVVSSSYVHHHVGEWISNNNSNELSDSDPKATQTLSSSFESSSITTPASNDDVAAPPPPRPQKPHKDYVNLQRRSFMNDPRNRVLPPVVISNSKIV